MRCLTLIIPPSSFVPFCWRITSSSFLLSTRVFYKSILRPQCSLQRTPFLWNAPLKDKKQLKKNTKCLDYKTDMRKIKRKFQRWEKTSSNTCNWIVAILAKRLRIFWHLGTCSNKGVKIKLPKEYHLAFTIFFEKFLQKIRFIWIPLRLKHLKPIQMEKDCPRTHWLVEFKLTTQVPIIQFRMFTSYSFSLCVHST